MVFFADHSFEFCLLADQSVKYLACESAGLVAIQQADDEADSPLAYGRIAGEKHQPAPALNAELHSQKPGLPIEIQSLNHSITFFKAPNVFTMVGLPVLSSVDHPFSATRRVNASTYLPDILVERFQRKAHQQTLLRLWVFSDRMVITIDPHFNRLRSLTT
jgi:hypothetical protein